MDLCSSEETADEKKTMESGSANAQSKLFSRKKSLSEDIGNIQDVHHRLAPLFSFHRLTET